MVANNIKFLDLKNLKTIVWEVCSIEDEKEIEFMLDFYHDLGIIVKLRKTVILKPQWLVTDVFRKLISIPDFNEMVM